MTLQIAFSTRISIPITLAPESAELIALKERFADGPAPRSASDLSELLQPKSTISYHWVEGRLDALPAA
jgi:hypothetical protein